MGGISIPQLLIILLIVVLLFGSKKLKSLGSDLGSAVKGFKKSVNDEKKEDADFIEEKPNSANQNQAQQSEQAKSKSQTD